MHQKKITSPLLRQAAPLAAALALSAPFAAYAATGWQQDVNSNWTYVQDDTPKAYILAIDVEFDAKFSIPGSDITYEYSEVGDPGNEITGIEDVKDGYRRMTTVCFAKFSDKMAENLGLEEIYFKEE